MYHFKFIEKPQGSAQLNLGLENGDSSTLVGMTRGMKDEILKRVQDDKLLTY